MVPITPLRLVPIQRYRHIAEDIAKKYPDLKPYKIEKEVGGYEIDIPGYDLYYSNNGIFIRAEIDK